MVEPSLQQNEPISDRLRVFGEERPLLGARMGGSVLYNKDLSVHQYAPFPVYMGRSGHLLMELVRAVRKELRVEPAAGPVEVAELELRGGSKALQSFEGPAARARE